LVLINQQVSLYHEQQYDILLHRGRTGNAKRVVLAAVVEKRKERQDRHTPRRCSERRQECSAGRTLGPPRLHAVMAELQDGRTEWPLGFTSHAGTRHGRNQGQTGHFRW
jgi:hypothetical protein